MKKIFTDIRYLKRKKDLSRAYEKLIKNSLSEYQQGLSATVYTQLSDIEEEVNGILSYDRKIVKIDENVVRNGTKNFILTGNSGKIDELRS